MKHLPISVCAVVATAIPQSSSVAETELKTALQRKHDLRSVSCFACHLRSSEVPDEKRAAYRENPKSFRNDFGEALYKHLKEKRITERLESVKDLKRDDPERMKVTEEVSKEFLKALEKVERVKSPSGATYGELLKSGKLYGVTLKEAPDAGP